MLFTQRLELIEGTVASLNAAIAVGRLTAAAGGAENSPAAHSAAAEHDVSLAEILHATVPASWPPEHLDTQALEWTIRHMEDPATRGSASMYWIVLREGATSRTLVGCVGFHTPAEGTVQVGYGLIPEYHRRGIATEATRALVAHLKQRPGVERIVAETYPDHVASLGVMRKCGFTFVGPGSEEGTVQYEIRGI